MQKTKTLAPRTREFTKSGYDQGTDESVSWNNAANIITSFTYESDFIRQCRIYDASPDDQTSYGYATALSAYTQGYIDTHLEDKTITPDEATRLQVIGGYPEYSYRGKIAEEWKSEKLGKDDLNFYLSCKAGLVHYNQALTDYMRTNGEDLKLQDIAVSILTAVGQMSPDTMEDLRRQLMVVLRGTRTEAINQQLVSRIEQMVPGMVKGRRATEQEDIAGVDYVVNLGGKTLYLDFKSSNGALMSDSVSKTREELADGYGLKTSKPVNGVRRTIALICPTFDEAALGDACALSDTDAGPAAVALANNLQKISAKV